MTLIELIMVIIIMGVISGIGIKTMTSNIEASKVEATKKEMELLAEAIVGNPTITKNGERTDFGYIGDVGSAPASLGQLVTNPGGYSTWNGPYIRVNFDSDSTEYSKDGWGSSYTYAKGDEGVYVTSTGSGTTIKKTIADHHLYLDSLSIQGTVLDMEGCPPGAYEDSVTVFITHPNGSGTNSTKSTAPTASGNFRFDGIPIGNRTVKAVYQPTHDTISTQVAVLPRTTGIAQLIFDRAIWKAANGVGANNIYYAPNTGRAYGSGSDSSIQFDIYNNTGQAITITSLIATYTRSPAAYYRYVYWGTTQVCNATGTYYASGGTATFSSSKVFNSNTRMTIYLKTFNTGTSGGGSAVPMTSIPFTITFSDGSVVTFTTPAS